MEELEFTPAEQQMADALLSAIRKNEPDYQLTVGDRVYIRAIVENRPPKFAYTGGQRYPVFFDRIVGGDPK